MKRYAGKHKKGNKTIFHQIFRRHARGMMAWTVAVVMVVSGTEERGYYKRDWQTVHAESAQAEISITSYMEQGATEKNAWITISSPQELRLLAQYVDQGYDTADRTFCLKDDITLSTLTFQYDSVTGRTGIYRQNVCIAATDKAGNIYKTLTAVGQTSLQECVDEGDIWYPIGDEEHPFQGCFRMNGHTVRGMVALTGESDQGLFGVIGTKGVVQNGKVEDSLVAGGTAAGGIAGSNHGNVKESSCQSTTVMGNGCTGGVAGNNTGSITQVTAENVIVAGKSSTMTAERDDMERVNGAGGITGYQKEGTILDCTLQGDSSSIVNGGGGIFGYMAGGSVEACSNYSDLSSLGANMGGIGGFIFQGSILSCHNYGNIWYAYRDVSHVNLSGIVAGSFCNGYRDIVIDGCINDGNILQKEREDSMEGVSLDSVGGIIGRMGGGMIGNCGNTGTVGILTDKDDSQGAEIGGASGVLQVGGIAAGCDGLSMIRNCYNTGDILGDIAYTGGIAGRKNGVELKSCYTTGQISQKLGKGQIAGFVEGNSIEDCFYLTGDNTSLYSEAAGGSFSVTNCRGVTQEEVENSLTDELNSYASCYGMDYFEQNCPLRKWRKSAGNYPVLSEEYLIASDDIRPPKVTRVPASSTEPDSGETSDAGETPKVSETPGISETPVPGENPGSSQEPEGTMARSRIVKETSLALAESTQIAKVKKLVVSSAKDGNLRITWNASGQNICYGIYRRDGQKSGYKKLAVVTGKTTWLDKKIQKGKKYRYQIFACRQENNTLLRSGVTVSKWIETAYYSAPKVTYKTENADGKRYLKLTLHRYRGDHIDIVLRKNGKEQIIKLHSISKYHGVFRFSYTKTGNFMYCKVRTWENRSGKKRFSEYTDMTKIKL